MWIEVVKSKIHRVRVTETQLNYEGSIGIDENLLKASSIHVHQKVQVVNLNNGERLDTYVIANPAGSGAISLNGAAARKAILGDILLVIAYGLIEEKDIHLFDPKIIFPDENNLPLIEKSN